MYKAHKGLRSTRGKKSKTFKSLKQINGIIFAWWINGRIETENRELSQRDVEEIQKREDSILEHV